VYSQKSKKVISTFAKLPFAHLQLAKGGFVLFQREGLWDGGFEAKVLACDGVVEMQAVGM